MLEDILNREVTTFAYPKGHYNKNVARWVKEAGFKEARTMSTGITSLKGISKFALPVTIHLYPNRWEKYRDYFKEAKDNDGYFHLVMHGWEIERFGLWDKLDEILKYINENRDNIG